MSNKTKSDKSRNRSAEARGQGRKLQSFILGAETDRAIERAIEHLTGEIGRCSKVQALEWLVKQGATKIPKKST